MDEARLALTKAPAARTGMLIRRPVAQVFEAFVDPEITTSFWFTRSSGKLLAGSQVRWEWEMYGVSIPVNVKLVDADKRIVIEWPGKDGPTTVEWEFTPVGKDSTFVGITHSGFQGSGDELVEQASDSATGFSWVLAGLKALLEHNVRLNLIADRYPKGLEPH